jgi:RNA polymerase sigma-70 factor (ECF subfamily)
MESGEAYTHLFPTPFQFCPAGASRPAIDNRGKRKRAMSTLMDGPHSFMEHLSRHDDLQFDPAPTHGEVVAALYREHHAALVALLQCRLNSRSDAQEIAQEVYVKLLTMKDLGHLETPRAFLFRMAINQSVDYLRKRVVRANLSPPPVSEDLHAAPLPEQHLWAGQQWKKVQAALRELPAKCSQAFVLHVLEGREFSAIATEMKLSERMVRYHVSRAMAHCRERCFAMETP